MDERGTAWVFPGQGSQEVGMGRDLYGGSAVARSLYERADEILGRSLSKLCFEGPPDVLGLTTNAQPALYVTSVACLEAAREAGVVEDQPLFVAGHSLGEYSALTAARALPFEDGIRLVEERGRLTQLAADSAPGRMAALLGMDESAAATVCADSGAELCNINSPGQLVIGGTVDAVERACALALERGARRAVPLDVGGAFHTSLMQPAVAGMAAAIAKTGIGDANVPVVANDRAEPIADAKIIGAELAYQLTHPVRWVQCVEYMAAHGVAEFVEIGPGRVLTGLIKRIVPAAILRNISGLPSKEPGAS